MYSVNLSNQVHRKINIFIDSYKKAFLKLFTDTGIFYENQIRQSYIDGTKKFQRDIYYSLENYLKEDIIGKKIVDNGYSTLILVGNYKIFIIFEEDIKMQIRFINDIEFYKK